MNKIKNALIYSIAIKVVILALLAFALYKQVFEGDTLHNISVQIESYSPAKGIEIFILLFVLMMINWSIEAYKWKLLIQKLAPIRFIRAFKAVWTGVTLGLFTPNRVGEFGGRILYIPKKYRLPSIVVSLIGSFSTIVITINIGIVCLLFFTYQKYHIDSFIFFIITSISLLFSIVITLAYYNLDIVVNALKKIKIFKRIQPYTNVFSKYSYSEYHKFILLSLVRYFVFTAQYLIFLYIFGINIGIIDGLTVVGVIYLTQTIFPTFAVAELLTRGNIAVYFLKFYSDNTIAPIAASTCLWLLNLIIPAILGYFFIIRFNFFKSKNT